MMQFSMIFEGQLAYPTRANEQHVMRDIVDFRRSEFSRKDMLLRLRWVAADLHAGMALFADHPCPLAIQKISNRPAAPIPPAQHIVTIP